jgi:hypothetical protein
MGFGLTYIFFARRALAKGQICCMAIVGQFQCGGKPLPYTRHCVQRK